MKEAEERDPKIQVSELCKKAILRVAELSSDDFHLDRHLYFACRDDRERFCENVSQLRNCSSLLPFLPKYFFILDSKIKPTQAVTCRKVTEMEGGVGPRITESYLGTGYGCSALR